MVADYPPSPSARISLALSLTPGRCFRRTCSYVLPHSLSHTHTHALAHTLSHTHTLSLTLSHARQMFPSHVLVRAASFSLTHTLTHVGTLSLTHSLSLTHALAHTLCHSILQHLFSNRWTDAVFRKTDRKCLSADVPVARADARRGPAGARPLLRFQRMSSR